MTNREKFLNGITNRNIARIILKEAENVGCTCCPVVNRCKGFEDNIECADRIEKWLGEKA